MLVSLKDVSKYNGEKCILDHVDFHVEEKDKIAILGVNGAGKSTLLKVVNKLEDCTGSIQYKKDLKINYLPQLPEYNKEDTILETVHNEIDTSSIDDYIIESTLGKFGIYDLNQKIGVLSGGQIKRVAIGISLIKPCDLLILDEPTNHLDNQMIEYLEKFLMKWHKGLLMVTHDRYFLERIVNKIVEVDHGRLYKYEANYSKYLELKNERIENELTAQRKRKLFLKKELEWVRAGVQARSTKSKDRLQRFEELSNIKDIEVNQNIQLIYNMSRMGNKTIELIDISKSYDQVLFNSFSYMFKKHDRIGILGENGVGKSTLLNIITGNLLPDTGHVDIGETIRFGYFKQGHDDLDNKLRVKEYIDQISRNFTTSTGETLSSKEMLERFLFDDALMYTYIERLSGGEKRRLYLLSVLMHLPNVLVLDEPTNDLDIETLTILEDYLDDFPGIIIVVSHDRYFLDRICDGLFLIKNKHIQYLNGGYSMNIDTSNKEEKIKNNTHEDYKKLKQPKVKLTYQEKKELETIEDEINDLENQLSKIDLQINTETDYIKLQSYTVQRDELEVLLENKNERYLYLLEKQENS